jgi:hypothetical protein
LRLNTLRVVSSGHSVDVISTASSKRAVVEAIAQRAGSGEVLRIGDRGRWPGNDFELLASPNGLSVSEVSGDLAHCWNMAPEGVRGVDATLYYLRCLTFEDRAGRLRLDGP